MDVDVIVEGRGALRVVEKLLTMVLEPIGQGYLPREETLSLKSIDIVSTIYDRGAAPVKILVDGYYVYVEPRESWLYATSRAGSSGGRERTGTRPSRSTRYGATAWTRSTCGGGQGRRESKTSLGSWHRS